MKIALLALLLTATLDSAPKIREPHSDFAPLLGGIRVGIARSAIHSAPSAQTPNSKPAYTYIRVGAPTNIQTHPRPGYALMGGGTDLDEAFRWLCDHADGGDFLVIRATGTDAYNPYIQGLCHLNSVSTLVIPDRATASDAFVTKTITNASAIFISGGDQGKYINFWAGTPVETALRQAVKNGVPFGGTSAGLAVLGQYIYSAQNDPPDGPDLTSDAALADPFNRQVVIAPDLLGIPILKGIITDTHFDTRKREGRLLVFMARILASGQTAKIRAIGVDEKTAVLVDPDGNAKVIGKGEADFFEASGKPQQCAPGKPLTFKTIIELPVLTGHTFDLAHWVGDVLPSQIMIENGSIAASSD
jgi:cyanophycinase